MPRTEAQRQAHNRRAARYRERHRAAINARQRATGKSEAARAAECVWRQKHAEELAAYQRAYYEANRERKIKQAIDSRRERRRADPEKARQESMRRRLGDHEAADFAPVLLADPCSYCDAPAETIDHIIARTRGGELGHENLTAACNRCNARKQTIPLLRFLLRTL